MTVYDKLPKKVWIGTYEFTIHVVDRNHDKLKSKGADDPDADGITTFAGQTIHIANDMTASLVLETVWHEITHAINWVNDIEDGADEEMICNLHGKAWSKFFIENPRFGRWFQAQCIAIRKERDHA